mmetsp:Transcript_4001/g.5830  ORF Transcript_4001/g.5830 Transcript_4001/m.5830 type:complete len:377 (+) Transcript_4001:445-1575(+)
MDVHREDEVVGDYKVFVGGLSWQTTEEGLKMFFEQFGPVVGAHIMRDRFTGQPRGFAFVTFENEETLNKILKCGKNHSIDGKEVEVKAVEAKKQVLDPSLGKDPAESKNDASNFLDPEKKIFVGGLTADTTEEDVSKYFSQYGTVRSVVIKYDATTHRSRGFGFVTFEDLAATDKASEIKHHQILGKRVELKRYEKPAAGAGAVPAKKEEEKGEEAAKPARVGYKDRTFESVYSKYFAEVEKRRIEAREREEQHRRRGPMRGRDGPYDRRDMGPPPPYRRDDNGPPPDRRGPPPDRRGPPPDRRGPPPDRRGPPPPDRRGPPPPDRRGPPGPPPDRMNRPGDDRRRPPPNRRGYDDRGPPRRGRGGGGGRDRYRPY